MMFHSPCLSPQSIHGIVRLVLHATVERASIECAARQIEPTFIQ